MEVESVPFEAEGVVEEELEQPSWNADQVISMVTVAEMRRKF